MDADGSSWVVANGSSWLRANNNQQQQSLPATRTRTMEKTTRNCNKQKSRASSWRQTFKTKLVTSPYPGIDRLSPMLFNIWMHIYPRMAILQNQTSCKSLISTNNASTSKRPESLLHFPASHQSPESDPTSSPTHQPIHPWLCLENERSNSQNYCPLRHTPAVILKNSSALNESEKFRKRIKGRFY